MLASVKKIASPQRPPSLSTLRVSRFFLPNHGEMSDSVFMDCPLLAAAARLSGDKLYGKVCRDHYEFMRTMCRRPDGGLPAFSVKRGGLGPGERFPGSRVGLGPQGNRAGFPDLAYYRNELGAHLKALVAFQNESGMWHQVIDHPESYPEFSATCMIGFALHQGLREGWLDRAAFQPAADRARDAVKRRIGSRWQSGLRGSATQHWETEDAAGLLSTPGYFSGGTIVAAPWPCSSLSSGMSGSAEPLAAGEPGTPENRGRVKGFLRHCRVWTRLPDFCIERSSEDSIRNFVHTSPIGEYLRHFLLPVLRQSFGNVSFAADQASV